MFDEIRCPDCEQKMEAGFVPDLNYGDAARRTVWCAGQPENMKFLGIGTRNIKTPRDAMQVVSYRCPKCGLLREYARD